VLYKSALTTEASGSLGGIVASHNKGGSYLRARVTPTDPASNQQLVIRGLMGQLANFWVSTLTAVQRAAWAVYAAQILQLNPFGDGRTLTGLNHYVRSNLPRLQQGLTRVDDAPTTFDKGSFTHFTQVVDATADEIDVTFLNTDSWAVAVGGALLVYVSRPQNPSVQFFIGPYRLAGAVLGAVVPPTSPTSLALPFPVVAGQRVYIRMQATQPDGRLSDPFRVGTAAA